MGNEENTIYSEGTTRKSGKNAQRMNILAAKLVSDTVRSTLGPKGMDKMLVDSQGNVTVTNDGVTILKQIDVDHPAAKMIIEIAKTQEQEVGDGTTSAVILAGELLKNAEELLEQNIHPTIITKGYRQAHDYAQKNIIHLAEAITNREETLKKIAMTAMTGKGPQEQREHLAQLIINAIKKINKNDEFEKEDIAIQKKIGPPIQQSTLINGLVIDKERAHLSMPKKIQDAKVALINCPIEIKGFENDTKIQINDPEKLQSFLDVEEQILKKITQHIIQTGATVVFCQKGIDDYAQYLLAKKGIYACRRIKKSDMEKISKACNATIVSDINDLKTEDLGRAGIIYEKKLGEDFVTFIEECENPKAVTLLIHGETPHIADEATRAVEDAIGDINATKQHIVYGAGNFEITLNQKINEFAETLSGKEQIAAKMFAKALEIIPKTLAENSGLDSLDKITELKSQLKNGNKYAGLNVYNGQIINSKEQGIIEPLKIKQQALSGACEVAILILRIDDVILANQINPDKE